MKKIKVLFVPLLVIVLRIFTLIWNFNTKNFDFSVYIINFYKMGNDYYLASIASAIYVLSALILLTSVFWKKQSKKLRLISILCLLLASAMEIIVYFLFQRDNMFVPGLLVSASSLFIGSLCVLLGFLAVEFFGKSTIILNVTVLIAIVLYFGYFLWEIFNGQNLNLTLTLSYVLNFMYFKDVTRDGSVSCYQKS